MDVLDKALSQLFEADLWREPIMHRDSPAESFAFDQEAIHNPSESQARDIDDWLDSLERLYGNLNIDDANTWGNENGPGTPVTLAWYQAITHYRERAGIFITDLGIWYYAALLQRKYTENWKKDNSIGPSRLPGNVRMAWALEVLLEHELFHHDVEWFSLKLNPIHNEQNLYDSYCRVVYSASGPLEEALATACMPRAMASARTKALFGSKIPEIGQLALEERIPRLPKGYNEGDKYLRNEEFKVGKIKLSAVINQLSPKPVFTYWPKSFMIGKGGLAKYLRDNAVIVPSFLNVGSVKPPISISFSVSSKAIEKLMRKIGYEVSNKGKGSHTVWQHPTLRAVTLPSRREFEGYQVLKNICESLGYETLHDLRKAVSKN
jgi:predicted RNA binding protein YcfA (HicA-like mRNA interferase family)